MSKISPTGFALIFFTIASTVIGQLVFKKGMLQVGPSPAQITLLPRFLVRAFTNPYVVMGVLCGVPTAVSWAVAVSRVDLSVAYPFLGLGLVLVLALSSLLFGEMVPMNRWIGVLIVCIGLAIAAH